MGFAPVMGYGPGAVSVSNPLISLVPHGQSSISGAVSGMSFGTGPPAPSTLLPLPRSLLSAAPSGLGLAKTKETSRSEGVDRYSNLDDCSDDSYVSPDANGRTPFQPVLSDSPGTHLNRQAHHEFFDQYRLFNPNKPSHNPGAEDRRRGRVERGESFGGAQGFPGSSLDGPSGQHRPRSRHRALDDSLLPLSSYGLSSHNQPLYSGAQPTGDAQDRKGKGQKRHRDSLEPDALLQQGLSQHLQYSSNDDDDICWGGKGHKFASGGGREYSDGAHNGLID